MTLRISKYISWGVVFLLVTTFRISSSRVRRWIFSIIIRISLQFVLQARRITLSQSILMNFNCSATQLHFPLLCSHLYALSFLSNRSRQYMHLKHTLLPRNPLQLLHHILSLKEQTIMLRVHFLKQRRLTLILQIIYQNLCIITLREINHKSLHPLIKYFLIKPLINNNNNNNSNSNIIIVK